MAGKIAHLMLNNNFLLTHMK